LKEESEQEAYRRIVDCVPACLCVANPADELLYINEVGVAASGRPLGEIIGERWMNYIHPDEADSVRSEW